MMCDTDFHYTWNRSYFHVVYDFKEQTMDWNRKFSKEVCTCLGNTFLNASIVIVLRELQIKSTLRFYLDHWEPPSSGVQFQQTLVCMWRKRNPAIMLVRVEAVVDTLETIQNILTTPEVKQSYEAMTSLLGRHWTDFIFYHRVIFTSVLIAAVFKISMKCRCPSTDE